MDSDTSKEVSKAASTSSSFDQLPPKMAFAGGFLLASTLMLGLMVVVALVMMSSGADFDKDDDDDKDDKKAAVVQDDDNDAPTPTPSNDVAEAPAPAGSIDLDNVNNVRGSGAITVVEYSDIDCPFCSRFHDTMKQVVEEYDGQVQWGYKHFPLTSLHPHATAKAVAAECAGAQGKFWEYTDGLFDNPSTSTDEIDTVAEEVGLDVAAFNDCIDSGEKDGVVSADANEATDLGGRGTPYSVIVDENGEILETIPGALPFDSVAQAVDKYL